MFLFVSMSCAPVGSSAHTDPLASHMIRAFSAKLCSPHHEEKQACPLPRIHILGQEALAEFLPYSLSSRHNQCTVLTVPSTFAGRPRALSQDFWEKADTASTAACEVLPVGARAWSQTSRHSLPSAGEPPPQSVVVKWLPWKGA